MFLLEQSVMASIPHAEVSYYEFCFGRKISEHI